ncbi:sensor histidine kinase [Opitutus sp. ER46]|uniref:sensor histidine kinase n=1 Tax=Opitutus sp. ER46 TaxID=2161864 RepID=UPI000D322160|nr:sensor histidine kinase [Opitutus sp. ER46]PTX96605.1 sensor histidine kinase [Opitutus sp. ER46]
MHSESNGGSAFANPGRDGAAPGRSAALSAAPATYYAEPGRASAAELARQLDVIAHDPVVDALLHAVAGLVAVLNDKRQVLAINAALLRLLGIEDPAKALGLRLGEAVGCVHAHAAPAGCGTTEYCSTCGAAIAQVTSLAQGEPVERTCAIDLKYPRHGSEQAYLRVQACPLVRNRHRILLLFIQDISEQQHRAALDRTFFHDVKNTVASILTAGQLMTMDPTNAADLAPKLVEISKRLVREIELQRCLSTMSVDRFQESLLPVDVATVLDDVARCYTNDPEAPDRRLEVARDAAFGTIVTDVTLLLRVVHNMVINALEATPVGGTVRVWADSTAEAVEFCVWNEGVIPPEIARRVFQRNFSTKGNLGRGLGTFSMKLLGERMLGGAVWFTSEASAGTTFHFRVPRLREERAGAKS